MEDFPEEFQHLRQDYDGLKYPGDLPGDLGLIPARPVQRSGWQIGPSSVRWLGLTAAAAAILLAAGGVWHAVSTSQVAIAPPAPTTLPTPSQVVVPPTPKSTIGNTSVASSAAKKATAAAAAVDDSIPLWSDVDTSSMSVSVSAGLPSQSLIMPTLSEVEAEKTTAQTAKSSPAKSS